jgi:T5orf172 domain
MGEVALGTRWLPKQEWCVYALCCEDTEGAFLVKIGISSSPYRRFNALSTGLPYTGVMLWMAVGYREAAQAIEGAAHKCLKDRRTRGEWFRFGLDEKNRLHGTLRRLVRARASRTLKWNRITDDDRVAYRRTTAAKRRAFVER